MQLVKNVEITKLEEALKKAKQKQKDSIKKINSDIANSLLMNLKENDKFRNELKDILIKYKLNNTFDLINKNYAIFEELKENHNDNIIKED